MDIAPELFLKEGKVICKCGVELYRYLKGEPVVGEIVWAEDFEPIGVAPTAVNGTDIRCYSCKRSWCVPSQEWLTDEERDARNI